MMTAKSASEVYQFQEYVNGNSRYVGSYPHNGRISFTEILEDGREIVPFPLGPMAVMSTKEAGRRGYKPTGQLLINVDGKWMPK